MSRIFKNFILFVFTAVTLALPAIYYLNRLAIDKRRAEADIDEIS